MNCRNCRHMNDNFICEKFDEELAKVRVWHDYWECPEYEEMCMDMLWDFKDNHDWEHIISVRDNPEHSFDLYKCKRCGAILLRKWGKEIIIKPSMGDNINSEVIAGGLEFDEAWRAWKESS